MHNYRKLFKSLSKGGIYALEVIRFILISNEYETYSSAEVFLENLDGDSNSINLSDVNLPNISGKESALKTYEINSFIPVLLLMVLDTIKGDVKAIKKSIKDYIEKPLNSYDRVVSLTTWDTVL